MKSLLKYVNMTLVIAAITVAGLAIWAINTDAVQTFITKATTRQPEGFSELYFTDHESLPKILAVDKNYDSSFTIVNHQGSAKSYTYQVTIVEGGHNRLLPPVKLLLLDGERRDQRFMVNTMRAGSTVQVIVKLLEDDRSIYFRAQS